MKGSTMKALLLAEYKKLELTDMPVPETGPEELLVRVKACGICGSDVHGFDGSTGRRIPPIVMGHEASGEVAGVGSQVRGFQEGDRPREELSCPLGQFLPVLVHVRSSPDACPRNAGRTSCTATIAAGW